MKLSELFENKKPTLSFEVFPPKSSDTYESVKNATEGIARQVAEQAIILSQ